MKVRKGVSQLDQVSGVFIQSDKEAADVLNEYFTSVYTLMKKQEVYLILNIIIVKGTHTLHFSSSLYIINQKPMIPRTDFHCITTWVARSSG